MAALRILLVGSQWWGGSAAGIARAMRRLGHVVKAVDSSHYVPQGKALTMRVIRRVLRRQFQLGLNAEILQYARILQPHFAVVYKGRAVRPETLEDLKQLGVPVFLVYPDVSFLGDSPLIPLCVPLYDWIFTTKSFGPHDVREHFGNSHIEFLPHGFDPDVHRPLPIDDQTRDLLGCEASFIGDYSLKKERYLTVLVQRFPELHLRIWGWRWRQRASAPELSHCIEGTEILGDPYPLAIGSSDINIALLCERRKGASSGDVSTSRTFQIPASGGFMLHERTEEAQGFFTEGEEMACFGSPKELAEKVRYYLAHPQERQAIRLAGRRRALAEHSLGRRVERIVARYGELAGEKRV